jgi:hypothetical protein
MPPLRRPSFAVRESARIVGWIVGLEAAITAIGGLLASHRAGSLAVQAFVAEWGAGRLGVAWSDPEAARPTTRVVARKVGVGLVLGLSAAAVTLAFAALTRAVTISPPSVAAPELLLGLVAAALVSVREELVLRGLVLRAFGTTLSPRLQILACGAVAAAAKLGRMEGTPIGSLGAASFTAAALAAAALGGICFATLWLRERGAFTAWGAHTAWTLATTTAMSGGVTDGRWSETRWGGGTLGFDASLAVVTGLGLVTVVALSAWYRGDARTR